MSEFSTLSERDITDRCIPEPNSGCWLWLYALNNGDGYGVISIDRKPFRANRASYAVFKGEIPEGIFVCHSCDVPSCVNPDHLFLGTNADNMRDMARKGRGKGGVAGEDHHRAILTENDVAAIRADSRPRQVIANEHGISLRHVYSIRSGEKWRGPLCR